MPPRPDRRSPAFGRVPRAVALAASLLVVPWAALPASAASHDRLDQLRASAHKLPKNLQTDDSFGRLNPARTGPVDVMLELDAKPAATAYALGLHTSRTNAAEASENQTDVVRAAQDRVVASLSSSATKGTVLYRTHALYAGVAVRTDASRLGALAALPGVKAIRPLTPKAPSNAVTVPLTGAPESWQSTGQTGEGVTIGIIDTGIDYTHADFGGPGTTAAYDSAHAKSTKKPSYPDTAKVAGGYDFAGDDYNADPNADSFNPVPSPDTNPLDCEGHGSHVAGTAGGYGVEADGSTFHGPYDTDTDFGGLQIGPGMAPGATLYALKVFGCEGSTSVVADALDWAADPNGDGDLSDHLDVVNMSLGSDFGSPDDPDAVATNNAVLAGISVMTSMGNGGDEFEVGGSPGDAVRTIAVAASDDTTDVYDGVAWKKNGVTQPVLVGQRSVAYDWANAAGVTNADLVSIGDWTSESTIEATNADGCDAFSGADQAAVTGKVVILAWTDDDSVRRCGSAGRSAQAKAAGAIGVVIADDQHRFAAGITGDADIPVMEVNDDGREALTAALGAGTVKVTLTNDLRNSTTIVSTGSDDPTDQIAEFSSRGTTSGFNVKPDVTAPGVTVFSAAVGTGEEGVSESGTSMAAPHTTGLAALVLAKHPGWTPEEVKAAIMGTADHSVYAEPGQAGQPLGQLRAGAGRIDAQAAVAAQTLAYNATDSGAVSVSFGQLDVTKKQTLTKKVTIVNKRATALANYTVSLDTTDALPGATWSVSPSAVSLPAGGSATVTVSLTVDPAALEHQPEPSLDLDPLGGANPALYRDWLSVTDGHVVFEPASGTSGGPVSVSVFAAPRPSAAMAASEPTVKVGGSTVNKHGKISLTGTPVNDGGASYSSVTGFELAATSDALPSCSATLIEGCVPFADGKAADITYVGASSSVPYSSTPEDGYLYFAVTSQGPWRTAAGIVENDVLLDVDRDGSPEAVLYNTRITGTDVFVAQTVDLESGEVIDLELLNDFGGAWDTSKLHGDAMFLPVNVGVLEDTYGDAFDGTVRYEVQSYTAYQSGPVDVVGSGLSLTLSGMAPAYQVSENIGGDVYTTLLDDQPGTLLTVKTVAASVSVDKPKGILLVHHANATGHRAEVVTVRSASTTTLKLSPTSVVEGKQAKATVTVTIPGTTSKPGGTIEIREGSKVVAKGTLSGGTVTITLPKLAVGKHALTAVYSGATKTAPSTSSSVTLTVTKK